MKSPLTSKPLRNSGESLDIEIDELINEKLIAYLAVLLMIFILTILEWYRWFKPIPYYPMFFTFISLAYLTFFLYQLSIIKKKLKNLKQGRDGEKAVDHFSERLREDDAQIPHDIPNESFNLDHVAAAKSGINVIETKTYSKPDKAEPTIIFDGKKVTLRGSGSY